MSPRKPKGGCWNCGGLDLVAAISAAIEAEQIKSAREAFTKAADEASEWGIEALFVQRLRSLARGST